MPNKQIVWHPLVHSRFQENLLYYLLRVRPFRKDDFNAKLENFLKQNRLSAYSIYQIYGTYDVLLRVYVPPSLEASFVPNLQRVITSVRQCNPFKVTSIPLCWCWEEGTGNIDRKALNELTIERVRQIQSEDKNLINWATSHNLLSIIERPLFLKETPYIRFFTGIVLPQGIGVEAHKELIEAIREHLKLRDKKGTIKRCSIYAGYGFASLMIKGETKSFYNICPLIHALGGNLVFLEGATLTNVVADDDPVECDNISEAAFEEMKKVDLAVNAIFPELYETKGISDDLRREIEDWITKQIIPRDLIRSQVDDVRSLLKGVLNDREEEIISSLMLVFARSERFLRDKRGVLIGKTLGPKAERDVLKAAGIAPEANKKFLNLGELLNIYSKTLEMAGIETDKKIVSGWQLSANLRNQVAHGKADCLRQWQKVLSIFVDFLVRFDRLADIINGVLDSTYNSV